jgi:Rieske Fe-S protein
MDESSSASRRAVLAVPGAAGMAVLLAGCQVYEDSPPASGAQPPAVSRDPAKPLARLDEIPVGGGRIFAADGVVVTRPESGRVRAFSTVCTHAGCAVAEVVDGTINCPCHGSKFAVADGSVVNGPARRSLPELPVAVENDTIRLT